ncbi:unnamed protein product [Paramecium octaurelia]|uniref:Uncharacterized protein n=1 Tax=Paramecium octaurelia TaxID=43137 RepID=A0A8S1SZ19_PAROT|nr:unnamed protein product [Paramecium octaurelia]
MSDHYIFHIPCIEQRIIKSITGEEDNCIYNGMCSQNYQNINIRMP